MGSNSGSALKLILKPASITALAISVFRLSINLRADPVAERLQSLVNSIDEGLGLRLARGLIALILISGIFTFYAFTQFRGLIEPSAMEAAQVARNVSSGKGMTTQCIRPFDIGYVEARGRGPLDVDTFPEMRIPPLYPGLLAIAFEVVRPSFDAGMNWKIYEPESMAILPLACLLIVVVAVLLTGLASRVFGWRVAAPALAVFALSESVYLAGISGTSAILSMLLTTATFGAVAWAISLRSRRVHALSWCGVVLLAGACCGLAVLTSYGLLAIAPAALFLLGVSLQRWRWTAVVLFLLALTIVLLPWMARNQVVTGSPFGLTTYTAVSNSPLYPDDTLERSDSPALRQDHVVRAVQVKIMQRLQRVMRSDIRALGEGIVVCFFLVAMFFRYDDEFANRLKWSVLIAVALLTVSVCLGSDMRLLSAIMPLVIIVGTGFFCEALDRLLIADDSWKKMAKIVFVLVAGAPTALTLFAIRPERPYPPYAPPYINYVSGLMGEGETLCTDIPWATAWYGGSPSLLLPRGTKALEKLHRDGLRIGGVYLTQATGDKQYVSELVTGRESAWLPLFRHMVPESFRWKHGFAMPPGSREQIFLTDRPRWDGGEVASSPSASSGQASNK